MDLDPVSKEVMVALREPGNVGEAGWDNRADVLKPCNSWHSSARSSTCHRQYFDSGCILGLLNVGRLCSLSDTRIMKVDGVKYSAGIHSPFCLEPCHKQSGARIIVAR